MSAPLYLQIAQSLRDQIDSGLLRAGDQLPTEDDLMVLHEASRTTVRAAVKELKDQGIVETRHGKGSFVSRLLEPLEITLTWDPDSGSGGGEGLVYEDEISRQGRKPTVAGFRREVEQARPWIARSLGISEGADVISRHEQRFVDGIPWSLQTSFYPRSLADLASALLSAQPMKQGTVAYLRHLGIQQAGYRDFVQVRAPNPAEKVFFGLEQGPGDRIIEISRLAFAGDKQPMRVTITAYRADRNRFVIEVGEVPPS
jgi:GntR family transcriptional regulator